MIIALLLILKVSLYLDVGFHISTQMHKELLTKNYKVSIWKILQISTSFNIIRGVYISALLPDSSLSLENFDNSSPH